MTRHFFSSLRFRLLLVISLAAVAPLAVIVNTAVEWRHHEAMDAQANALQLARHAFAIHERLIKGARDMLYSLAQLPAVSQADEAGLSEILLAFLREHSDYNDLGVIRPDGKIFCSARPPGDSTDVADRPFFRRAVETRNFAIGDYEIGGITGKTTVTFAYPVLDKAGRVQRVLFAVMALDWISDLVAAALLPDGTTVTVFDEKGTIVAHEPDGKKWVGQSALQGPVFQAVLARKGEGTFEGTSLDSIPRLFAVKPLRGRSAAGNLYVSIGIPTAVAIAESNRILARNLIGFGLAAVLTIVAAWVGSDLFFLRRVKALVGATMRLSGGDLTARTGLAYGSGELGQLTRTFDEMATSLERRRAEAAQAEEALRVANDTLRALIHASPLAIVAVDLDGKVTMWNPAAQRIFGWSEEEVLGRPNPIVPEDKREEFHAVIDAVKKGETFANLELYRQIKDGSYITVSVSTAPVHDAKGDVVGIMGILADITERLQAAEALRKVHDELEMRVHERTTELQRANEDLRAEIRKRTVIEGTLRESQTQLAGIIGSAMDGIITVDEDQRVLLFNRAAERIFRCSAAEAMDQPIERFIPERFRDRHRGGVRAFAQAGATNWEKGRQLSMIGLRADGEKFALEATISQSEAAGHPIYTIILHDITERQRADETLRKLSRVVEQTGDSVFVTDRDGTIEYANPSFEQLTGFSREEVIGANPRIFKSGKHDMRFYEILWNTIRSGEVFRSAFTNKRKDGRLYHEDQTITPIRDSHGNITHFVSTGRDITERIRMEEQLRNSQEQLRSLAGHLESVREDERGRVAREIHDELGQALTALKYDLSWLANRLAGEHPGLLAETRAMIKLVDSTIQLVRRISSELRPGVLDDLGLVAALEWQAQDFETRTGIACEFSSGVADTGLDREVATTFFRICQETLTNVIRHAEASTVEIFLEEESAHLILSVQDNGKGIRAEEIANRTSLGILGMRERARLLGGTVSIVGRPGEGTRVTVDIPLKRTQGNMA